MKIISFFGKGGSGKSTLTTNLADALVELGHNVGVLDMDHQATASRHYNLESASGIVDLMEGTKNILEVYHKIDNGLAIIPTNSKLAKLEMNGEVNLTQHVRSLQRMGADYFIIDCPPHICASLIQALMISDLSIFPLVHEGFMATPIFDAYMTITDIRKGNKPKLAAAVNKYARHLSSTKVLEDPIKHRLKEWEITVFKASVRKTSAFSTAAILGKSILKAKPSHGASNDLRALAKEIVNYMEES